MIIGLKTLCFVSQNTFQKLVRRMTRFFVCTSYEETVEKLCRLLDRLSYTWKIAAKVVCSNILLTLFYMLIMYLKKAFLFCILSSYIS